MDAEKLRALQIRPDAKERPQGALWMIFLGVALITAAGIYFAWPRPDGERRVTAGAKTAPEAGGKSPAAATPAALSTNTSAQVARPGDAVLTVSGYIVNRERIELSPRFMGLVKWIGVKKGDAVTNGQVVVRLDDAEQRARLLETDGPLKRIEKNSDPKKELERVLRTATEWSPQRLKRFDINAAKARVVDHISNFSLLRKLSAFQSLESDLAALKEGGWK